MPAADHVSVKSNGTKEFSSPQTKKELLRFIICGSVDDGKSTLLGRLLCDSGTVPEDQFEEAGTASRVHGTQGDDVDLALLVDGLQAEREQGITIDVAWRHFETNRRRFIAIDTPGHEQYTRNMVVGATAADLALILVDVRKGILTQTRRHSHIASLMGIRHVILAVNKMDLVGHNAAMFQTVSDDYKSFASELKFQDVAAVPISALTGENVCSVCGGMPWYEGPTVLELLEATETHRDNAACGFRLPVQWINRPNPDFRGFSGTVASGSIKRGMPVVVSPSGHTSFVRRIVGPSSDLENAIEGQSVTLVLGDEIDVSRGDMIADAGSPPNITDQFAGHLIWLDAHPMLPERQYLARFASACAIARISDLTHRIDVNSLNQLAAKTLEMNEIGYCKISLDRRVPFDPYTENRQTGSFVLIDRFTNATVGAGLIGFSLRRGSNVIWQEMKVDKSLRAAAIGQKPCVIWLTGLSGAGKSTVADLLEQKLHALGMHTYLLDGDNLRHGLNRDLGFTDPDRVENIRRVAEVAKLMIDAGLIVIVSFISPFRSERQFARSLVEDGEFLEIFIDAPLSVCEERDPKGLYARARSGKLLNFTGIDSPYERPECPELHIDTTKLPADEAADAIGRMLKTLR